MDQGSIQDPSWREPMQGQLLRAEPMKSGSDWETLQKHAQDPRLYDLGFGMEEQPTVDYLKQCTLGRPDMAVWEAWVGPKHVGWLIYSMWTHLPCISAWFFDSVWNETWWCEGMSLMADKFFATEPEPNMLFAHFMEPVSDDTESWVVGLGFAPADQAMFIRSLERKIYGLPRAVYDMFHEEIDEDEFDDY